MMILCYFHINFQLKPAASSQQPSLFSSAFNFQPDPSEQPGG